MLVGIPTGSYFGIALDSLPPVLRGLVVLDTLDQAFIFLLLTWAIGAIHILVGLLIELKDDLVARRFGRAVYDQAPTVLFLVSGVVTLFSWLISTIFEIDGTLTAITGTSVKILLVAIVLIVLAKGRFISVMVGAVSGLVGASRRRENANRLDDGLLTASVALALAGALLGGGAGILAWVGSACTAIAGLVVGSKVKEALAALGSGIYSLYGMTAFIGDLLSYSRLMALGLVTVLIGFVVNTFIVMVAGMPVPLPLAILFAALIGLVGHGLNLLVNLLGAFVHPLRLQFVEFFKHFYENGGRAMRPFAFETENMILRQQEKEAVSV